MSIVGPTRLVCYRSKPETHVIIVTLLREDTAFDNNNRVNKIPIWFLVWLPILVLGRQVIEIIKVSINKDDFITCTHSLVSKDRLQTFAESSNMISHPLYAMLCY